MSKEKIPLAVRNAVWGKYVGMSYNALCFCCNFEPITKVNYECGHIISEKNGGKIHLDNLRPICSACNKSVGSKNMEHFMEQYGFIKNNNWNGIKINQTFLMSANVSNKITHAMENISISDNVLNNESNNDIESDIKDDLVTKNKKSKKHVVCKARSRNNLLSGPEVFLDELTFEKIKRLCTMFSLSLRGTKNDLIKRIINIKKSLSKNLDMLTFKQLKQLCIMFNLSQCGTKNELIQIIINKYSFDEILTEIIKIYSEKYMVKCAGNLKTYFDRCGRDPILEAVVTTDTPPVSGMNIRRIDFNSDHIYFTDDQFWNKNVQVICDGSLLHLYMKDKMQCKICKNITYMRIYVNEFYKFADSSPNVKIPCDCYVVSKDSEETVSEETVSEETVSEETVSEEIVSEETVSEKQSQLSEYQQFIKKEIPRQRKLDPGLVNKEYMIKAATEWRTQRRRSQKKQSQKKQSQKKTVAKKNTTITSSEYQQFIKKEIPRQRKLNPGLVNKEYMIKAAAEWRKR